jgi:hypothetical protein
MSLEFMMDIQYFPYYTKEELLEMVKQWQNPQQATDYIIKYYDVRKKEREDFENEILNKPTCKDGKHLYSYHWKRGKIKGLKCTLCGHLDKNK